MTSWRKIHMLGLEDHVKGVAVDKSDGDDLSFKFAFEKPARICRSKN